MIFSSFFNPRVLLRPALASLFFHLFGTLAKFEQKSHLGTNTCRLSGRTRTQGWPTEGPGSRKS